MLVKFHENNQTTTFIKSIVTSTPLPIYDCLQDGDRIIADCVYIYKGRVIKCTVGGILDRRMNDLEPGRAYVNLDNSRFIVLDDCDFPGYYQNLFRKETCPNSYYDTDTHRLLGKYLRAIRSYHGIDLMTMYNCFDGTYLDDIYIEPKEEYYFTLGSLSTVRVLFVPIKFNTEYTIYIDGKRPVVMCPIFRGPAGFTNIAINPVHKAKNRFDAAYDAKRHMYDHTSPDETSEEFAYYKKQNVGYYADSFKPFTARMTFKNPYVWKGIKCQDQEVYEFQNYLGLLIQIESHNNSSVVVLEGDRKNESRIVFNAQNNTWLDKKVNEPVTSHNRRLPSRRRGVKYILDEYTTQQFNNLFRNKKQLTLINDRNTYAFNDKLLPFLLHHNITNMETIEKNIGRVQEYIPNLNTYEDIWNDRIRVDAYNKFMSNYKETNFDVTGFIDADIEHYFLKNEGRIMK